MPLTTLVDQIDALVTRRAKTSTIKPLLISLREQCEAAELRILTLDLETKNPPFKAEVEALKRDLEEAKKKNAQMQAYYSSPPQPEQRPSPYS
jgi:glycerophosphoryl diester phosphodiesterase